MIPRRGHRAEIDEEIRSHLRLAIADRMARGESPADAERHARRELGNELLVRERMADTWSVAALERGLQNVRYAGRQMRRRPGFAAIAVLTLGLGLGAVTGAFAIVNSVLLEPLRYHDPGRLYSVVNLPPPGTPNRYWLINGRHFHEWRARCRSCADIAMADNTSFHLAGGEGTERLPGLRVSHNFFRTLGVRPALGRDFRPDEELPGAARVLILSHGTWRDRFGAESAVLGRSVIVNGEPYVVVGVMPEDFRLPLGSQWGPSFGPPDVQPAMFRPLGEDFSQARPAGNNNYQAVLRLAPGVEAGQAVAELNTLIADFVRQYRIQPKPTLLPLGDTVTRDARPGLLLLFGIAATTLLIVCVNIGNLILLRTASREREVGIRLALGSSQRQLFGLVIAEAMVLVAAGAVVAVVVAYGALEAFRVWAPRDVPRLAEVRVGIDAWLFGVSAAVAATLMSGLLPAWRMTRTDLQQALKTRTLSHGAGGSRSRTRLGALMVGTEVALSTVLLIVGGLFTASFIRVLSVPKGVDIEHVVTQDVSTSIAGYTGADRVRFANEAIQRLATIPGVVAAGVTNQVPLRGETWICQLRDAGPPEQSPIALANFRFVSAGYWDASGIPVVRGRPFAEADRERPVAVLSERAARALWPNVDPIGKRVGGCNTSSLEVVGVVGDVRADLEKDAPIIVYEPHWTMPIARPYFVVRTRVAPESVAGEMRSILRDLNPAFAIGPAETMREIVDRSVTGRRFQMHLVAGFAAFALLLASLGIYGVISFSVARRTPELGIRLALGARPAALGAMVLRQGLAPVVGGIAVGLIGALAAGRAVSSELFGVAPSDPWIMTGVAVALIVVGVCACGLPVRRAMRIDPLSSLRFE
jgi:putative ABC transport system permease protein